MNYLLFHILKKLWSYFTENGKSRQWHIIDNTRGNNQAKYYTVKPVNYKQKKHRLLLWRKGVCIFCENKLYNQQSISHNCFLGKKFI